MYLNSSHLFHQHSDLVNMLFCPSARHYFHQISSHHFMWVSIHHLLHCTSTAITAFSSIIFNHIPLHPIADPVKLGAMFLFVPAEMSPMFPHGCIIPPRIKHSFWHRNFIVWVYLSISLSLLSFSRSCFFTLILLTCTSKVPATILCCFKTMTDTVCYLVIRFGSFLRDETDGKRGGNTHTYKHSHTQPPHKDSAAGLCVCHEKKALM